MACVFYPERNSAGYRARRGCRFVVHRRCTEARKAKCISYIAAKFTLFSVMGDYCYVAFWRVL